MVRKQILLDSRYNLSPDVNNKGYSFKFDKVIEMSAGELRIENFIFQNSEYVFSSANERKTERFIFQNVTQDGPLYDFTIKGTFADANSFLSKFNSLLTSHNVKMTYNAEELEFKIFHTGGDVFKFSDYYDDGKFMEMLGFEHTNEGANFYVNTKIPKLFSTQNLFIYMDEIGAYDGQVVGIQPYTFVIQTKPSFETIINNNETYAFPLAFPLSIKNLTIHLKNDSGLSFSNVKSNANFKMVLSYDSK